MRFLVGMSFLLVFHTSLVLAEAPIMRAGPVYIYKPDVVSVVIEFPHGAPARAPAAADFRLRLANGDFVTTTTQKSKFFRESGEGLALVICVDVSGTIGPGILDEVKKALLWLIAQESRFIRPKDKIALISFADEEETELSFEKTPAQSAEAIRNLKLAIGKLKIRGHKTKLFQTVSKALDSFQGDGIPKRKRIIVISDGKDEGSVDSSMSVTDKSTSLGIPIDTVGYGKIDEQYVEALKNLSNETGGQFVHARPDRLSLSDALARIYNDLLETRSLVVSFKYKFKSEANKIKYEADKAFVELTQLDQTPLQAKIPQPIPQPIPQETVDIFINKDNPFFPQTPSQKLTAVIGLITAIISFIIKLKNLLAPLLDKFSPSLAKLFSKFFKVKSFLEFGQQVKKAKAGAKDIEDAVTAGGVKPALAPAGEVGKQPAREIVLGAWESLQKLVFDACAARKIPVTPGLKIPAAVRRLRDANAINAEIASQFDVLGALGQKLVDEPAFKPQKNDAMVYKAMADVLGDWMRLKIHDPRRVKQPTSPPQTVVGEHMPQPQPGSPGAWLVGIDGPVRGQRFSLEKESCRLGSDADNDLYIKGDEYVSGHHALLRYEKGSLFLRDQESRNGSFLNEKPVTGTPVVVRPGDHIRLGESVFLVEAAPTGAG